MAKPSWRSGTNGRNDAFDERCDLTRKSSRFRYSDQLALEDAVHTAILTLKESFEGQMTEDNIEIGICDKEGFRRLTPAEVKDYLAQIA